VNVRRFWEADW